MDFINGLCKGAANVVGQDVLGLNDRFCKGAASIVSQEVLGFNDRLFVWLLASMVGEIKYINPQVRGLWALIMDFSTGVASIVGKRVWGFICYQCGLQF